MRTYTVHRHRRTVGDPDHEADAIVFVKEGFCWPALFVPVLWLIYHRMWLSLGGYLGVTILLGGISGALDVDPLVSTTVFACLQFLLAAEGGELRRWTLARQGYEFVALAYGSSVFEAETAYFKTWVDDVAAQRAEEAGNEAGITFRLGVPASQIESPT